MHEGPVVCQPELIFKGDKFYSDELFTFDHDKNLLVYESKGQLCHKLAHPLFYAHFIPNEAEMLIKSLAQRKMNEVFGGKLEILTIPG